VDGAKRLHEYLHERHPSIDAIIELVIQTFSAVNHMRLQRVLHWDIKSANVLVNNYGIAKLIDFGSAKLLDRIGSSDVKAITTKGKYPPIPNVILPSDDQKETWRFMIELPHSSWHDEYIDLWMLAREWNSLLRLSSTFNFGEPDLSDEDTSELRSAIAEDGSPRAAEKLDCLRIVFERILSPFAERRIHNIVSPDGGFVKSSLYYQAADDVIKELERILPPFGAGTKVPELLTSLDDIVRLPVTGNGVFTERISAIVNSKVGRVTSLHYQLAQTWRVFPGAAHTRWEHMLGTVATAVQFVRSLYLNDGNAFWRISATSFDLRAVLLAAILHDVGHVAFGHFVEEMDELVAGLKHEDYVKRLLALAIDLARSNVKFGPTAWPEGAFDIRYDEIVDFVERLQDWCDPDDKEGAADLLEHVLAILDRSTASIPPDGYLTKAGTKLALYGAMNSIVDGPIDADKLDYLTRDSWHAGVFAAAGIDIERFFESLRVCVSTEIESGSDIAAVIGVSEKGVAAVETVITARYHLYSTVYWHRTVRLTTAMLQRLLSEVRLRLPDSQWLPFFAELLGQFRRQADRQALLWLRFALGQLWPKTSGAPPAPAADSELPGLLGVAIAPASEMELAPGRVRVTFSDLLDALIDEREGYFGMAYELAYAGSTHGAQGQNTLEKLHDKICNAVHASPTAGGTALLDHKGHVSRPDFGMSCCKSVEALRANIEKAFSEYISAVSGERFDVDTILLDVPEPGKDQIEGLLVDRRGKRSRRSERYSKVLGIPAYVFERIEFVSPIAEDLAHAFEKWARKVRIFMSPADLDWLYRHGFESGDLAQIWENVLIAYFKVDRIRPTVST
jgi:HD superfamily phosphohydrolase